MSGFLRSFESEELQDLAVKRLETNLEVYLGEEYSVYDYTSETDAE